MIQKDKQYLEAAYNIAKHLAKEAIWDEDRCNWIGCHVEYLDGTFQNAFRSFGSDIYSGTSGIALFLTEIVLETKDPVIANCLNGAIQTTLYHLENIKTENHFGFYAGRFGTGYALWQIGQKMNNPEWQKKGLQTVLALDATEIPEHEIDIIAGPAGTIPVLLKMHEKEQLPQLLSIAKKCGEFLLSKANKTESGWSWKTVGGNYGLTGYSHGTAGISLALLELYYVVPDDKYWHAAMAGFQYESQWYDSTQNNWPDLREYDGKSPMNFCQMWCHGAPGIALSRIRAYQLTGMDIFIQDAQNALNSTYQNLLKPPVNKPNYSLCHGLYGNADILLYGAQIFNEPGPAQLAEKIAKEGIQIYDKTNTVWPSGVNDPTGMSIGQEEAPGLMLGLAGTGYFLMRMYNPENIESLLICSPSSSALKTKSEKKQLQTLN